MEPPLPYSDASFDLIYAFSVFTHLTEPLQHLWMAEMRRVLRPGGYLLFSTHGDRFVGCLSPADRASYDAGKLVVTSQQDVGMNSCASYHPERYVREELARRFAVLDFVPAGALGNFPQDAWLLQRASL